MKWLAGGFAYACITFYLLAGLMGMLLALLTQIALILGLGIAGHFFIQALCKRAAEDDDLARKHHDP